jgi:hypothetical protein
MNKAQANAQNCLHQNLIFRVLQLMIFCALSMSGMAQDNTGNAVQRGAELAKRVLQKQYTSGFRIRARAVIGANPEDPAASSVLQVRIVGRREKSKTQILYQILWPTSRKGTALVFELGTHPRISGFLFVPPDRITPITDSLIASPFAGTALTIEDLAENYWLWPSQRIAGQGRAGDRRCTILESRPSQETASAYAIVRSCITKNSPLWVEKLTADNHIVKRITFEISNREDNRQDYRLAMIVEGDDKSQRTRVEFLKSERDLKISLDEFSVEQLKSLVGAKP